MATQPTYIYGDTANAVLNTARSRVDDLIQTPFGSPTGADPGQQQTQVGGSTLLAELNPDGSLCLRTQIIFNSAYRKMKRYLGNMGYRLLIGDDLVISLPPNTNADPAKRSWISWNGSFDGTTFTSTPALPADFHAPLFLWERLTSQNTSVFRPMGEAPDGLFSQFVRGIINCQWEWRASGLYLPGANTQTDIKFRYINNQCPDLVAAGSPSVPWYYQLLPIPDCLSCLAWYICYEVCVPRIGDAESAGILALAESEANLIFNDQVRADQRVNTRRIPRGRSTRGNRQGCY